MSLLKYTFAQSNGDTVDCWVLHIDNDEFWFQGGAIATYLEYRNPWDALISHIRPEWRRSWSELAGEYLPKDFELPPNWQPHSTFIHECGLYALINKSHKPEALQFQKWLTGNLLPTLRREGTKVESERMDALQSRIDKNEDEIQRLGRMAAEMTERVAVMPHNEALKHVVNVLKRSSDKDNDVADYCVIRCQKRHLHSVLRRMKDYESIRNQERVSNATNVLTRCKEILREDRVPYKAWGVNKIRTVSAHFERILNALLDRDRLILTAFAQASDDGGARRLVGKQCVCTKMLK